MHCRNFKYNEFLSFLPSFLLPCVPSSRCFNIAVVRFVVRFRDVVYSSRQGSDLKNKMTNNTKPQPVEPSESKNHTGNFNTVVSQLRRLVASFSTRRPAFISRRVHVAFADKKVAVGQVSLLSTYAFSLSVQLHQNSI